MCPSPFPPGSGMHSDLSGVSCLFVSSGDVPSLRAMSCYVSGHLSQGILETLGPESGASAAGEDTGAQCTHRECSLVSLTGLVSGCASPGLLHRSRPWLLSVRPYPTVLWVCVVQTRASRAPGHACLLSPIPATFEMWLHPQLHTYRGVEEGSRDPHGTPM